ncbi:MAG: tRNA (adenosine(37)-N6)-threonylcarbamoyltransferase complex ATPase subunit type 1 TsaE [bacterium]|nr:tRNA (adenosine(37)-N6)-threonylcarbamoyltransferase complex ATPase subunit type 1 TsaE [bacterium]
MENTFSTISNSIEDTKNIAEKLSLFLKNNGGLICMYGDIGAGKTALTSMCAKFLGVKEKVTSPSFVILNEYHSGEIDIYHFDLYRLENEGLRSIIEELRTYSEDKHSLTFVEWAEFSDGELDVNRLEILIKYKGDTQREFVFKNISFSTADDFNKLETELKR